MSNIFLLLTPSIHTGGGAERVLVNLANFLVKKGFDVKILTIINGAQPLYELSTQATIRRFHFGYLMDYFARFPIFKLLNRWFASYYLEKSIAETIDSNTYYIISFSANLSIQAARTRYASRLLAFEHLPLRKYHASLKMLYQINSLYPAINRVIVLSDSEKKLYEQMGCHVFRMTNSYSRYPPKPAQLGNKIVLSVGHFNSQKRRDLLIHAWSYVHACNPEWQLYIVGEGPLQSMVESLIDQMNLADSVQIFPPTDSIHLFYEQASVFVLSSELEMLPLVILEAKAYGLPCVAFNISPGPVEQINHQVDGFLADFGDTRTMAEYINRLIDDTELRISMGANGRKDVIKRYSPTVVEGLWEQLLNEI
jgi:glycosyltransferase involved in cell wall biosynthesis